MKDKLTISDIQNILKEYGSPYLNLYTLSSLLFKKGIITEDEYIEEMQSTLELIDKQTSLNISTDELKDLLKGSKFNSSSD